MNILLINNYYPPEIGAASHLYYYLAKKLINRGHNVYVLTGIPRYNIEKKIYLSYKNQNRKKIIIENSSEGVKVLRVKLPYVERRQLLRRGLEHFEIAFKLFFYSKKSLLSNPIDVSLVYSPPLTLYWTASRIRKMLGTPFVLNVQDLFPQAAIDLGVIKNPLLIRFFKQLEKKAYKESDLITVHSENNKKYIEKIADKPEKVLVVENWIDEDEIKPGNKGNEFAKKYGLVDKFVVSFAGTLGFSQDMEVIVRAANLLKNMKDIMFIIVGDGVRLEETKRLIKELQLKNILLIPPVPREKYPLVLNSSDLSLATLTKDVKTPVVPSKILSIMSAGIPVIASMNLEGDAPKLIENANAGYVVPPGDFRSLAEKIMILYKNPELRKALGRNGRNYIENNLSASYAAKIYEEIFEKLIKNRKARR